VSPRRWTLRAAGLLTALLAPLVFPAVAAAQAFTPPKGVGAITLGWQWIQNTGHRATDGTDNGQGDSVTTSLGLETEYGVTDRLSAGVGIPYTFAKYLGPPFTPISGQPYDACRCWNSAFGDFSFFARYRLGGETWAVTPLVRVGKPSHAYPFRGEAVVGKQLREALVGVFTGLRLVELLPSATVQAGYTYAFVEKAIDEISVNRSDAFVDFGYVVRRRLYVRATWLWEHTHGGKRIGSPSGDPFPMPGELDDGPGWLVESNRIRKVRYMQLTGGLVYDAGPVDVYGTFTKYVWGTDSHNGYVFGAGVTFYFGLP
jgi:hypothetical protein